MRSAPNNTELAQAELRSYKEYIDKLNDEALKAALNKLHTAFENLLNINLDNAHTLLHLFTYINRSPITFWLDQAEFKKHLDDTFEALQDHYKPNLERAAIYGALNALRSLAPNQYYIDAKNKFTVNCSYSNDEQINDAARVLLNKMDDFIKADHFSENSLLSCISFLNYFGFTIDKTHKAHDFYRSEYEALKNLIDEKNNSCQMKREKDQREQKEAENKLGHEKSKTKLAEDINKFRDYLAQLEQNNVMKIDAENILNAVIAQQMDLGSEISTRQYNLLSGIIVTTHSAIINPTDEENFTRFQLLIDQANGTYMLKRQAEAVGEIISGLSVILLTVVATMIALASLVLGLAVNPLFLIGCIVAAATVFAVAGANSLENHLGNKQKRANTLMNSIGTLTTKDIEAKEKCPNLAAPCRLFQKAWKNNLSATNQKLSAPTYA